RVGRERGQGGVRDPPGPPVAGRAPAAHHRHSRTGTDDRGRVRRPRHGRRGGEGVFPERPPGAGSGGPCRPHLAAPRDHAGAGRGRAGSVRTSLRGGGGAGRGGVLLRRRGPAERRLTPVAEGKVASMRDAVAELVRDGDAVAIEGFTHLICFAAGHEIIRQRKRDLTLCRLTPDVIYDQMIGAGVARKLVFSWLGNPGVGSLHAIRRRVERADPEPLEIEEYSHFGMVCRYVAGASRLPFFPIRSYYESDLPKANPRIVPIRSPYGDETVYA